MSNWAEDRARDQTPVRDARCISCGRVHAPRPFLREVTDEHRKRYRGADGQRAGDHRFPVPPVDTSRWDDDAWIRWIDGHGEWAEGGR